VISTNSPMHCSPPSSSSRTRPAWFRCPDAYPPFCAIPQQVTECAQLHGMPFIVGIWFGWKFVVTSDGPTAWGT
jgi:hypothetical protein